MCELSTQEVEAGGAEVQGHFQLCSEFEAFLWFPAPTSESPGTPVPGDPEPSFWSSRVPEYTCHTYRQAGTHTHPKQTTNK